MGAATKIGATKSTSYDDKPDVAGTIYYYWVKATNAVCVSDFSASDSGYRKVQRGRIFIEGADPDGGEDVGFIRICVRRADGSDGAASVYYATSDGTARAPGDYSSKSGKLTWPDGTSGDMCIDIPVVSDGKIEGKETFQFDISDATGASMDSPSSLTVDLLDSRGKIRLVSSSLSVNEGNGYVRVNVRRVEGARGATEVNVNTTDGSAIWGSDYNRKSAEGYVHWNDGEHGDKYIDYNILDDALVEGDETFTVSLQSNIYSYAPIAEPDSACVTILDNDQLVMLEVDPIATNEEAGALSGRQIAVAANVSWTAATNVPWLQITAGASGATNGTVTYSVLANESTSSRTGGIVVAGGDISRTCTVIQAGAAQTKIIGLSGDLAFGSVTVGQTSTRTLTITNGGNAVLAVSSISYPSGFSGNWNNGPIAAGRSTNVTVTFSPTAAQAYSGTVTVNSDKTGGTNTISCSGTGVANPVNYAILLSASPSAGGTVSGGGTYVSGSSRTVTATANSGYTFANWTEGGAIVSTSASYTFTLAGNRTLVANFTANPVNYAISLSASPSAGGTVSGGGTYVSGSSRTVTATASSGYTFANWTEGGAIISTSASYTFTLTGNRTLVANFNRPCLVAWGGDYDGGYLTIPTEAQSGVTAIAAAWQSALALKNGQVLAWGSTYYGICNLPEETQAGVTAIAGGANHAMALKNGRVLAWGTNEYGQCNVPTGALSGVTAIAGGGTHSVALKNGRVLAWGNNTNGQCTVPTEAQSGVTAIAAGVRHTLALKNGKVLAWGFNGSGECTVPAAAQSGVTAIAAGWDFSAALKNGQVLVWGYNVDGQCNVPTEAQSGVTAIAAALDTLAAIKNGGVLVWGNTLCNQDDIPTEAQTEVADIAVGSDYILALRSQPGADTMAPGVQITVPTTAASYASSTNRLTIGGTASDNVGVAGVKVRNFRDVADYACAGTTSWQFAGLPIFQGTNRIAAVATDSAGNSATDVLSVTYSGDAFYDGELRSGAVLQEIDFPDNLTPGDTVPVRWKLLSYVPVRACLDAGEGTATGWLLVKNGTFTGVADSAWNISQTSGKKYASLYSFACDWTVPNHPGDFRAWFNVSQQDGRQYMIATVPEGVDSRPDPSSSKVILRTILPGGTNTNPQTETRLSDPSAWLFDNLSDIKKRSGGTITSITLPDNLVAGTQTTCQWTVMAYMDIDAEAYFVDMAGQTLLQEVVGTQTAATDSTYHFSFNGTNYLAREYTFRATFTVPDAVGVKQVYFRHRLRGNANSTWMAANIAPGVDDRAYLYNGMYGRFIERTIVSP